MDMIAIALLIGIAVILGLELVGVYRAERGHTDTISELWWKLTGAVPRPYHWGLNIALVAGLVWLAVHLICHCGI